MQEPADTELLRQYAEQNSDAAFAALVARHVNLVYSAAIRMTRNSAAAEEITQAVFIILDKKARALRRETIFSGWLYQTARLTAANFVRGEIRRARREQEAFMQSLSNESGQSADEAETWLEIEPLLEDAMGRLNEKERNAVVLRFFEGRSFQEIGTAFGGSENAAKKRVIRGLDKLRNFFARRGVNSTAEIIGGAISANSIQTAPAALAKSAAAAALAKSAVAGGSALTLAKATLIAVKTKTLIATVAASLLVVGTGIYLLVGTKSSSLAVATDTQPVALANDTFVAVGAYIETLAAVGQKRSADWLQRVAYKDDQFVNDVDPDVRRTTNSPPAGHIKSLVAPKGSGAADYLASLNSAKPLHSARYIRYDLGKHSALLGKRIRVSGWVKTRDVANWAGGALAIINADGHIFACDAMTDRPISGTTDWRQIEIVTDAPSEPCAVYFGPMLYGTGELWCDDFKIEAVPNDMPITDDRIWHVWSSNPNDYSMTTDYRTQHNGHAPLCITYTPKGFAPRGSWMWWGQDIRNPDKYRGHTVRMTAWIKTEKVSNISQNLRPKGADFKLLANCTHSPASGTTDWTEHVITCTVPKDTQCLDTGFAFSGSGKVWIDMDSLKYEIADNAR